MSVPPSSSGPPADARIALQRRLPPIIAGLSTVGPFAIDTYLPAFGSIAADLAATPIQVQQTLTAYIAPFALMALWHGALSDALGRRAVVLAGLLAFAVASIGAALAQSIEALWFWRAVQGAVGGVGMTVGRAVVRDVADGPTAQRMLSQATMMFALAPAIAPIFGGWLHAVAGWRACFVFLAGVALCLALFCWRFLPETLPPERRVSLRPASMARAYARMVTHGPFLRLSAALGLNFAGFFLYVLAAPEFLVKTLGVSTEAFGWLFLPSIAGTMLGAFASSRLAGRLRPVATIRLGYLMMFAAVAVNLAMSFLMTPPRIPWATLPLLGYNFGLALAMASLQVMALDLFEARRGMAASGMAFTQSAGNAVVAGALAPLLWHSAGTMALGALAAVTCGFALFAWQMRVGRSPKL